MRGFHNSRNKSRRGTTLVESLIAVAVVGIGFAAFISFNSHQLRTVRSTHEVISSNLSLQERIEQMRIATWRQLTDPQYVKTTYFAAGPLSAAPINNLSEQLKITAYPDETACTPLIAKRDGDSGTVVLLGSGDGLYSQRTAKVLLQVSWTSLGGRQRVRQSVAIVSNGGVNRMTLPAFGSVASGTSSTTTTTTTTSNDNGNGNGNGNAYGRGDVGNANGVN